MEIQYEAVIEWYQTLTAALLRTELQYLRLLKHHLDSVPPSHIIVLKHV